jgi:hypothetical protein
MLAVSPANGLDRNRPSRDGRVCELDVEHLCGNPLTDVPSKGWPANDRADPSVQSVATGQQISEIAQRIQ